MNVTVIGAGNGGLAAAADLTLRGHRVTLFEFPPFESALNSIREKGTIGLSALPSTGLAGGFAKPHRLTTDMAEALGDAEVILLIVPAVAHFLCAAEMAGHLKKGQIVVLMPGGFGGAILFSRYLANEKGSQGFLVAESSTLPYACRKLDPSSVWIRGRKGVFDVAAYPSRDSDRVLAVLNGLFPAAIRAKSTLETGLNNLNPFIHPPIVLFNAGATERGQRILFYHEGVTPSVQRVVEGLDRERLSLGMSLGLTLQPIHQVMLDHYRHQGAAGEDFRTVAGKNPVYRWSEMPGNIDSRYLTEDVPMSLVPIRSLARKMGTPCRLMESVIHLSSQAVGKDLEQEGRTLADLGLEHLEIEEIVTSL